MRTLYSLAFVLAGWQVCFSQQVLWAKTFDNIYPRFYDCHLAAGGDGSVYYYGIGDDLAAKEKKGFISKLNAGGNLVYLHAFTGTVVPAFMTAGPKNRMYVCGYFSGNAKIGSHAFTSNGSSDGFTAALDEAGNILWVVVFDGPGGDALNGIAYNTVTGMVVTSGGISSALSVNGKVHDVVAEKSMVVAELSQQGQLLKYRLHDFLPNDTTGNYGMEVHADAAGRYYLLHHREGKLWFEPNQPGDERGIYLSQLDQNFSPVWTNFIINGGCYYGYSCRRMATTSAGACFVPTWCSGKYGGTGLIRGYSQLGTCTSTVSNDDGSYQAVCTDGISTYAVGTESANGCPCPSSSPGYRVARKFEQNGNTSSLITFDSRVFLTSVAATQGGPVIVAGFFHDSVLHVGSHHLVNKFSGMQPFIFALAQTQQITSLPAKGQELFTLYPNPSEGEIHLRLPQEAECQVEVTNMLGQTLCRHGGRPAGDGTVHLQGLPGGVCLVTVTSGERRLVKKVLVKQK
jgi:hypothetical protein